MTDKKTFEAMSRRDIMKVSAAAIGAGLVGVSMSAAATDSKPTGVVSTTDGKVRGLSENGVHIFKGIKYGKTTAGGGRFLPPVAPTPWSDVYDAVDYGPISPQRHPSGKRLVRGALMDSPKSPLTSMPKFDLTEGEDCLNLNLWTTDLKAKKPVMVWIHGGGYNNGSGSSALTDGTNLALKGDVVVVSVTHRLSFLGFTYLGYKDARYAASGNVGMLDLVRALEWVRDNIAAFGGDPDSVTIFGCSGGAGKVSNLLAMPSAKGLFKRAILESGASVYQRETPAAIDTTEELLIDLGLADLPAAEQLEALETMPLETLTKGYFDMLQRTGRNAMEFSPHVDGDILPVHPAYPKLPETSKDVTVMLGMNETEHAYAYMARPEIFDLTEEELFKRLTFIVSVPTAKRAIALYKKLYPDASPARLLFLINTDHSMRKNTGTMADLRALEASAATYLYNLDFTSPYMDGKLGSPHVLEIPLVFGTYEISGMRDFVGTDARAKKMSDIMMSCWTSFAHGKVPSAKGVPEWKPYTTTTRDTMVFDEVTGLVSDPRSAVRHFWRDADYQII